MKMKGPESLPWDQAALERLERIPVLVRGRAKDNIERAAKAAGETRVTVAFMEANKPKSVLR